MRSIGLARATVKIGLANIAYNMRRAVWLMARHPAGVLVFDSESARFLSIFEARGDV